MTGPEQHANTVGREGMVTVYDHYGQYVGCVGSETWAWLLAHPELDADALVALADRADTLERGPCRCDRCRCDRCRDCVAADGYEAALERADELQRELESAVACAMEYRSEREQARAEANRLREALGVIDHDYHWIIAEPDPDAGQHLDGCVGCFSRAALAGPQTEEQE